MRLVAIAFALTGLAVSFAACSSSTSANRPCNEDPFSCSPGLTCWINASQSYACVTAGTKKAGEACSPVIGSVSPCGEQLVCFGTSASSGVCTAYCDPSIPGRGCTNGADCVEAAVVGVAGRTRVCKPTAAPVTDAGTTTGDAATSADAKTD